MNEWELEKLNKEIKTVATQKPNIYDLAKAAGVSISTASKAMNDKFDVKQDTKEHVRKVAAALGYEANQAARAMALKTSDASLTLAPKAAVVGLLKAVKNWLVTGIPDHGELRTHSEALEQALKTGRA